MVQMHIIQQPENKGLLVMTLDELFDFVNNDEARSNELWEDYTQEELLTDGLDFYNCELVEIIDV